MNCMNKEIFYRLLYRFKHKCPYFDPLIQTILSVLGDFMSVLIVYCDTRLLYVSVCFK